MSGPRNTAKVQEWIIANEFAQVRLTIDRRGNDPRLRIEDLTSDVSVAFDAFLLAGPDHGFGRGSRAAHESRSQNPRQRRLDLDRRKLPGDGRIRQCALQRRRRAARKLSGWGPDGADRDPTRDLIQEAAGVESIDDLRMAIQRSDGMRTLQTEFDRLANALAQDGDGLSIAALSAECESHRSRRDCPGCG